MEYTTLTDRRLAAEKELIEKYSKKKCRALTDKELKTVDMIVRLFVK